MGDLLIFPKYILLKILFQLPMKNIIRLRRVNRYIKDLVSIENIDFNYELLTGRQFPWIIYLVLSNPIKWQWRYGELSASENVLWEYVLEFPEIPWDFGGLSRNVNVRWEHVESRMDKMDSTEDYEYDEDGPEDPMPNVWSMDDLSSNPNITWDIVMANQHLEWDPESLCCNPNVTWDIVTAQQHFELRYRWLSSNPNITWDRVLANPNIPGGWKYNRLSENPNITWDIVMANPDVPGGWDYNYLCQNPSITLEQLKSVPSKWRYYALSRNPNITWNDVMLDMKSDRVDKEKNYWDWEHLAIRFPKEFVKNPNLLNRLN